MGNTLMMYTYGPIQFDTRPLTAHQMARESGVDAPDKGVIGGIDNDEMTGQSETVKITGTVLPAKLGGMNELEKLDDIMKTGKVYPLMRGDGVRMGTYRLTRLSEAHKDLMKDGVGFAVNYTANFKRVPDDPKAQRTTVPDLLEAFDLFKLFR